VKSRATTADVSAWAKLRTVLAPGAQKAAEEARVAEQRTREQALAVEASTRRVALQADIKSRLRLVCAALGQLLAVMPSGDSVRPQADAMLLQLEATSPQPQQV
jgi:hypothetical protein